MAAAAAAADVAVAVVSPEIRGVSIPRRVPQPAHSSSAERVFSPASEFVDLSVSLSSSSLLQLASVLVSYLSGFVGLMPSYWPRITEAAKKKGLTTAGVPVFKTTKVCSPQSQSIAYRDPVLKTTSHRSR